MIKLGLDFYDTVTAAPKVYRKLAQSIIDNGGEVHIISHVHPGKEVALTKDLKHTHIPHTALHIITTLKYHEVPALKRTIIRNLGIDIYLDDRADVLTALPPTVVRLLVI